MIRQTLGIFLDSYRELRAKRLFGLALILSVIVMAGFACIGVNEQSLTVLRWELPRAFISPLVLYKFAFVYGIVGYWLAFGATILALVSVASVFPDFLSGGSIDLYLSKPIGRLRLFLTKYLAGLMFVTLQMTAFAVAAYFILGLRGGLWRASVFLSIPIVVCYFSYLYCLLVFFGVWTRSTIAALILTVIAWAIISGVQTTERWSLQFMNLAKDNAEYQERLVGQRQKQLDNLTRSGTTRPTSEQTYDALSDSLARAKTEQVRQQEIQQRLTTVHDWLYVAATVIPKTAATSTLLDRFLITDNDVQLWMNMRPESRNRGFVDPEREERRARMQAANEESAIAFRNRSISWLVGTSLVFEAVVLSLSAWIFWRRDY